MNINTEKIAQLQNTYNQMIEWVKFAEQKNGALVAFGGAVLFGASRLVMSANEIPQVVMYYYILFCVLVGASALTAIISFIPSLDEETKKAYSINPLFYGDACKYSKEEYWWLFNNRFGGNPSEAGLEMALCDQIVINAWVAYKKYSMFTIGVWLFLGAVLTPVGALIIWLTKKWH